jgi:hypothetical protein
VPFVLFFTAVGGVVLAAVYFMYTSFRGARRVAHCPVPGDVFVDLDPADNPVRIALRSLPDRTERAPRLRVELEREGSWLWSREIELTATSRPPRCVVVDDFSVDRPGRYRVRGAVSGAVRGLRPGIAALEVCVRVHRVRPAIYFVAAGLFVGGFGGLAVLLAR